MKLLHRLEKSKDFWFLLIAFIGFFGLRFPSLFEPNWYGDEGIYQAIGLAMDRGRILYSQIWDNKPPLLYIVYALLHSDQFTIRIVSLLFGLVTLFILYLLSLKLFQQRFIAIFVASFFGFVFAIPLFEGNIANAENFILLPILIAAYLIYTKNQSIKKSASFLFAGGLLLGIAFLFKIVAVFDFLAFFLFLFFIISKSISFSLFSRKSFAFIFRYFFLFFIGFLVPFFITCIYFLIHHAFMNFIESAFLDNIGYVGYKNSFFIPQGFLFLKLFLLIVYTSIIFIYRKNFDKSTLFVLLWLGFSVFSAFFSQRPYTHYILVVLPSFSLGLGLLLYHSAAKFKTLLFIFLLVLSFILLKSFNNYGYQKTYLYYQNFFQYISGRISIDSYRAFFDPITPRDYAVATFLKSHVRPYESIFLWGNSAQIYALSQTLPASRYTVAYHITQSSSTINQTISDLTRSRPRYVIILAGTPPIPFAIDSYNQAFSFPGASIYERTY
jgi:4-amino-4-deoxy-L-arabinose transferase-like glycosyltransferase